LVTVRASDAGFVEPSGRYLVEGLRGVAAWAEELNVFSCCLSLVEFQALAIVEAVMVCSGANDTVELQMLSRTAANAFPASGGDESGFQFS